MNADTKIVSTLTSHGAGYLDKDLEKIVGLQTDEPFKRALQPFGGIRMSEGALEMYGYQIDPTVKEIFTTLTAVAVLSATIVVWRCTVLIISFRRKKRTNSQSTAI